MIVEQVWFAKSLSCCGDTKAVSGALPGLLAVRVFSCQIALQLSSNIESSRLMCLSCAVVKPQSVVHEVQVMTGLRSHTMLYTSGWNFCVC